MKNAVYLKGLSKEMNQLARFTYAFFGNAPTLLRLAAGATFRIAVNGKFAYYGPLRSEHGVATLRAYDLTRFLEEGENLLSVEVTAYNINTYYIVDEPAFFAAEVLREGKVIATQADFTAERLAEKIQKVQKYSFQRDFVEVYDKNRAAIPAEVEEVPLPPLREVDLTEPDYGVLPFACIERGIAEEREGLWEYRIPDYARVGGTCKGYTDEEVEVNLLSEINRLYFRPKTENHTAPYRYKLYDLGKTKTGFINFSLKAEEEVTLYVTFDEILLEEEKGDPNKADTVCKEVLRLSPMRSDTINGAKITFPKGEHEFALFEPYTMRYLKLCWKGKASLSDVFLRTFENPDAYRFFADAGEEKCNAILTAAASTFSQNAVDVLTDCPSRERAGWLCDSYFSGRSERLFTGENRVERHFLRTILRHNQGKTGNLPKGMFPMCYPADFPHGQYIPNWSMWLVLELERYLNETGDRVLIEEFRPAIFDLLTFFEGFENADGLLEKLEAWVFVEWSAANGFVQDVNYPSNMLYAAVLEAAHRLYGEQSYLVRAARVRKGVEEQSFNGEFYADNALRGEDGVLRLTKNVTETCQYYAMFFGFATRENHPALYQRMIGAFGPFRDRTAVYPEVHPSNAFIGNYLRLEILLRDGLYQKVLDESVEFFYKMAERTGSLWEHDNPGASCCHGFASKAAVYLVQALFGYAEGELTEGFVAKNAKALVPQGEGTVLEITVKDGKRTHRLLQK